MRYHHVISYNTLPKPTADLDSKDAEVVAESDLGFDCLAEELSRHYLVDSGDGQGGAVIHMVRYFEPCRHHTVVVDEPAWHKVIITAMHDVLQGLPEGWTFGIDATEFPPGQAHIVVTKSGDVFGWAEYQARGTLVKFGFPKFINPMRLVSGWIAASRLGRGGA